MSKRRARRTDPHAHHSARQRLDQIWEFVELERRASHAGITLSVSCVPLVETAAIVLAPAAAGTSAKGERSDQSGSRSNKRAMQTPKEAAALLLPHVYSPGDARK
jgi:hypothetical protein